MRCLLCSPITYAVVSLAFCLIVSCKETKSDSGGYTPPSLDSVSRALEQGVDYSPTNPEGGQVSGLSPRMTSEENQKRIRQNKDASIVLGESVANITMQTTFAESLGVLSQPIVGAGGSYAYGESIIISWAEQNPRKPTRIDIIEGYQGVMQLPERFGAIRIGSSFRAWFEKSSPEELILELGRYFDGKDESYHCLNLNSCALVIDGEFVQFAFRMGWLIFSGGEQRYLEQVSFRTEVPEPSPPITDDVTFGYGLTAANVLSSLESVTFRVGDPLGLSYEGGFLYDNGNISIFYSRNAPFLVTHIAFERGFDGVIKDFPGGIGEVKMRDSLSEFFAPNDFNGLQFLKTLGAAIDGKSDDPNWDCIRVQSCSMFVSAFYWQFIFDNSSFIVSRNNSKTLERIIFYPRLPERTQPREDPVVFGSSVGAITSSSTKADVESELGKPREIRSFDGTHFYDNGNIGITYSTEDTIEYLRLYFGYEGVLNFPANYGSVKMGDSFSEKFTESDPTGEDFIKELGAHFKAEAAEYDCLLEGSCKIENVSGAIVFRFEAGDIHFREDFTREMFFLEYAQNNLDREIAE